MSGLDRKHGVSLCFASDLEGETAKGQSSCCDNTLFEPTALPDASKSSASVLVRVVVTH